MAKIQSVEPNIADLANGWLKSYKRDYKLEQESLNTEIDQALILLEESIAAASDRIDGAAKVTNSFPLHQINEERARFPV